MKKVRCAVLSMISAMTCFSACGMWAQGAYGPQGGRTIYEESAKQREHDAYINQQSRSNTNYNSNGSSSKPSIPSWQVRVAPYHDYRKDPPVPRWTPAGNPSAGAATRTLQDYFAEQKAGAARGSMAAKEKLALCYYWGDGTAVNKAEAYRLWKELGAKNPADQTTAAGMLYGGDGVAKDEITGMEMFKEAAARGDANAKEWLAGSADTPASVEKFAGDKNYIPMMRYGWEMLYGENGFPKNEAKGLEYLKRAAQAGEVHAETFLGFAYEFGDGTPVDNAQASQWFQKADAHGDTVAPYQLAWVYYDQAATKKELLSESRRWSDKALKLEASGGNYFQRACIEYRAGNMEKARAYYEKGAELNNPDSLWNAGIMELRGDGGAADATAGLKHMEAGAQIGDMKAYYELGTAYQRGLYGVGKDEAKATANFQAAADKGMFAAMNNLAIALYRGRGVPVDYEKSAVYAKKAYEGGSTDSAYMLAVMYQEGQGVSKDAATSVDWMKKAAAAGNESAKQELAAGFTGK